MDAKTPVADQLIGKQQRSMRLWMFVSRYGTLAAFLVMAIVLSFVAPGFLTMFNILTILRQISVLGTGPWDDLGDGGRRHRPVHR